MSHPWVEGIDQSDLIGFYNHFLDKADDGQVADVLQDAEDQESLLENTDVS